MPAESRLSSHRLDGSFIQQTRRYGLSARVAPPMQGASNIPAIEFMHVPFRSITAGTLVADFLTWTQPEPGPNIASLVRQVCRGNRCRESDKS